MRKLSILLLSGLLLSACTNETNNINHEGINEEIANAEDETIVQPTKEADESSLKEAEETGESNTLKILGKYMAKNTFLNTFGNEALENYLEIDDQLTYMEFDETGKITNPNGSTMEEVIELIDTAIVKSTVRAAKDEANNLATITFHYLDPSNLPENEEDEFDNYADISYAFENNQLYLSNITPGWFEIDIHDLLDAETLNKSKNIENLPKDNSNFKILTLGKMNIDNHPFIQLMIPTKFKDNDQQEIPVSHYLYFVNDQLIFANYIPFYETSENLPFYSTQAMNGYFQEMNETKNK